MELMELGGMTPTSVTTAVMHDGGVRSYSGLRISRLGRLCSCNNSRGFVRGNDENVSPMGAARFVIRELNAENVLLLTELILGETVQLNTLGELVRLTTNNNGHRMLLRHHGYQGGARSRIDCAIRMYGVCTDEDCRHFGNDRTKSRKEEIRALNTG